MGGMLGCTLQTPAALLVAGVCVLFNIFISGLEEAMRCPHIKPADDKPLGRVAFPGQARGMDQQELHKIQ